MKISDVTTAKPLTSLRRRQNAGGAGFDAYLDAPGEADAVPSAAPAAPADALLALQEVTDDSRERNRRAAQEGTETLDVLEQLRVALLHGALPESALLAIHQRVSRQLAEASDPQLAAILQDIELRAAVELAKLEVAAVKLL